MQRLEVSCAVRRFFKSLGFKGLNILAASDFYGVLFFTSLLNAPNIAYHTYFKFLPQIISFHC